MVIGVKGNIKISSADRFRQIFIFAFRVNDDNISIKHQEMRKISSLVVIRFSGTGFGKSD